MGSKSPSEKHKKSTGKKYAHGKHPNSLKALKPVPWKPGQSGNPKGRAKRKTITDEIYEILEEMFPGQNEKTNREVLARVLIKEAMKGSFPCMKEIIDRHDGRVPLKQETTEEHNVNVKHELDLMNLPDDEKRDYREILSKLVRRQRSGAGRN